MNIGIMVRMNPGCNLVTGISKCPQLKQDVANNIQNLSVRVKARSAPCHDFWSSMDLSILRQFGSSEVLRRSCKILLQLQPGSNRAGIELLDVLKTLVGFKNVELRATVDVKPEEPLESREKIILQAYETIGSLLSLGLGSGSVGRDEEGFFMSFNPR